MVVQRSDFSALALLLLEASLTASCSDSGKPSFGKECVCAFADECCDGCSAVNANGACTIASDACHHAGACSAESGACVPVLDAGYCFLDGACVPDQTEDAANTCRWCDVVYSQTRWREKAENSSCNDGNLCTAGDKCVSNQCTGVLTVICAPENDCQQVAECNPATGTCPAPTNLADGTSCDDSNACTPRDECLAGQCQGFDPVECQPLDQCHQAGTCDPITGSCDDPQRQNGASCELADLCIVGESCQEGVCTGGAPRTCDPPGQCEQAGECQSGTGTCLYPPKTDGVHCTSGALAGLCKTGACSSCGNGACDAGEDATSCPGDCPPFSYVFVTSTELADGDLGGIAGADQRCATQAAAAKLPGTYKAWLSSGTSSPATTFFRSPHPYIKLDGELFASSWDDLDRTNQALDVSEYGVKVTSLTAPYAWVWSNTSPRGTAIDPVNDCAGWTSGASELQGRMGSTPATDEIQSWADAGTASCRALFSGRPMRLYCFQQGVTTARCGNTRCEYAESCSTCPQDCGECPASYAVAFLTSGTYTGALGGLTGADAICQTHAEAAKLNGTFKAWLSDATGSPATRFAQLDLPYLTTRLDLLANNWADLTDGTLLHPLDIDERGIERGAATAQSATKGDGTYFGGGACVDWTSADTGSAALRGDASKSDSLWTLSPPIPTCDDASGHLYCFEQDSASTTCGDGACTLTEGRYDCPEDCLCGNGICDLGETRATCVLDCTCGDAVCAPDESCWTCASDCGGCGGYAYAFVTSQEWPAGFGGLAAADALCQQRAAAAHLPGTYKAWLADATSSPDNRFAKLTVPYVRPDRRLLALSYASLVAQGPRLPLNVDEGGNVQSVAWPVWNDVALDGTLRAGPNCNAWTASSGSVQLAQTTGVGSSFPAAGASVACYTSAHLYCFGQEPVVEQCGDRSCGVFESAAACPADCACGNGACDANESALTCLRDCSCGDGVCDSEESCASCASDCGPCSAFSYVFATSTSSPGNLGGLAGADTLCQQRATAAGLPGTYRAWLATSSAGASTPAARFTPAGPYVRRDGAIVANSWADLIDGSLRAPLELDELGAAVSGDVWTSVGPSGIYSGFETCSSWTAGTSGAWGYTGLADRIDYFWTMASAIRCNSSARLYCFEQEALADSCGDGFCSPFEVGAASCAADCP